MSAIVEIENISKCFGAVRVLEDVSFTVQKGSVVAIIGASGSGKSTALRCIDRLEQVEKGRIRVCGHDVTGPGLDLQKLRRDVGIVFQSYNLFPHLTVAENIMLAPRLVLKNRRADARQRAMEVLAQVGLAEKADNYPSQLSGGQQQRVAIARSLAMSPQLMLFDEVTSALDPQLTGEVLRVMEGLAADGMTMILVTHEMAFARKVADEIVFMHKGRVWETGPASILDAPATTELRDFVGNGL
ncbi:MAG: amino acid ABC transporter ATP-binding protein [Janthinobacterium lividum]